MDDREGTPFELTDFYTLPRTARKLGVSETTVRSMIAAGEIKAVRVRHRIFIRGDEAEKARVPMTEGNR